MYFVNLFYIILQFILKSNPWWHLLKCLHAGCWYLENNDDIEPPDDELIGEEVVDAGEGDLLGLGLQLRGLGRGEGQQEQGQGAAQGGKRGKGHGGSVVSTSRKVSTKLGEDADGIY